MRSVWLARREVRSATAVDQDSPIEAPTGEVRHQTVERTEQRRIAALELADARRV